MTAKNPSRAGKRDDTSERRAADLEGLLALWRATPRARGGWWALAGFSFQSALYLQRFFLGLQEGAQSPAELAKTELLSDIFVPEGGAYTLTQVKRTLDRSALADALREAYEIARRCEPALLDRLNFRIACLACETPARPADFAVEAVVKDEKHRDAETWSRMLARFAADAVFVAPDPLDRLYDMLWHAGIADPSGFVDDCLGILLRLFADPGEQAIAEIAWQLNSAFQQAKGAESVARIGHLLRAGDLALDARAATDREILFDRRPQFSDIRLGRVRERKEVLDGLLTTFEPWWRGVTAAAGAAKIPVFWIEGRSGEGKSVLLLQLAHRLALNPHPPLISLLRSADELPAWVERQRAIQEVGQSAGALPALALVDDLHFIRDRDAFEAELHPPVGTSPPRVAVLACGPSNERKTFAQDFGALFDSDGFTVPNLGGVEMREFSNWFAQRTGQNALDIVDPENRMLVVWMFELLRRESIATFARNFGRRLEELGLFDFARAILAANALELPAPASLFEALPDRQRDAFEALCSQTQLHFAQTAPGVDTFVGYRLSHPQIVWQMYRAWFSPDTLPAQWGRDLAISLIAAAKRSDRNYANQLIFALGTSARLSTESPGGLDQALRELYRKQFEKLSPAEAAPQLPRWLEIQFRGSAGRLEPDPVQAAIKLASRPAQPISNAVASWLWRISETQPYSSRAVELRTAAESLLFDAPDLPTTGWALGAIASKSADAAAAFDLCRRWLVANPTHPQGYELLKPLVATRSDDRELIEIALRWAEANASHPLAYQLLSPLVAARPTDHKAIAAALTWLAANSTVVQAHQLLGVLVAAQPDDAKLINAALIWLETSLTHPQVYKLFGALVAAQPDNATVIDAARTWVETNPNHPHAYELLTALVAAQPDDAKVIGAALTWVRRNAAHPQVRVLLTTLVAARPEDEEMIGVALTWVERDPTRPEAYEVLRTLVAARPGDTPVIEAALTWIKTNPNHLQAHELLKPLIAARADEDEVIAVARNWLARSSRHPNAYIVLVSLISRSGADEWMHHGEQMLATVSPAGRRELLRVLLGRSEASRHYVDLTLDAVATESQQRNRNVLLHSLARALANNLQNALQYLSGEPEGERRRVATRALARGLRQFPNRAEEFLALVDAAPPDDVGLMLAACIESEVTDEHLTPVLRQWLNDHRRARGYGTVLRALKGRPTRLNALIALGGLRRAVVEDYENSDPATSAGAMP